MKKEMFKTEISYIKNPKYRENAEIIMELLPDYFYEIPAASTGKYHPAYAQGEGGLVRHTKSAVRIAKTILDNEIIGAPFKPEEKDLMILGLMIHDGLKCGLVKEKYTKVDHPILISNYLKDNKDKLSFTENELKFICNIVETHMGAFTRDFKGNEVLERPVNKYQKFVHMCDDLSSKKFLNINFDNNEIVD